MTSRRYGILGKSSECAMVVRTSSIITCMGAFHCTSCNDHRIHHHPKVTKIYMRTGLAPPGQDVPTSTQTNFVPCCAFTKNERKHAFPRPGIEGSEFLQILPMFRPNPDQHLQCAHEHTQDACDCSHHRDQSYPRQYLKYAVRIRHELEKQAEWDPPPAAAAKPDCKPLPQAIWANEWCSAHIHIMQQQ